MCESDNKDFINEVKEGGCTKKGTAECKGSCADNILKNMEVKEGTIQTQKNEPLIDLLSKGKKGNF